MVTVTMVKKLKDSNNRTYGYLIRDNYGNETGIYAVDLKDNIRKGLCTVTNLTLTSDNRLVEKTKNINVEEKPTLVKPDVKSRKTSQAPSICGIQIKNIKIGHGREGEYYYGTVYYMGRKLGMWGQDPNGCISDNFEFNTNILDSALKAYRIKVCDLNTSLEALMSQVVILSEYYKSFTKMLKQGKYSKLTIITDEYDCQYIELKHNGINAAISNSIDIASHKIEKAGMGVVVKHFNSENDFIIE